MGRRLRMNEKLENILIIAKEWTGSIMSIENIYKQYLELTPAKKNYIYKKTEQKVKEIDDLMKNYEADNEHAFNNNIETRLGFISIEMNLIALENDTKHMKLDPAVVLLCRLDSRNKKLKI